MDLEFPQEILKDGSYYDFDEATNNYGFDFAAFSKEGLHQFIRETYLRDFIAFRKSFISRDLAKVRLYAHKFKGTFKLMVSPHVYTVCEELQILIQKGMVEVSEMYQEVVIRMLEFLNRIIVFSQQIRNPLNENEISQFWRDNALCTEYEASYIKTRLSDRLSPVVTGSTLATEQNIVGNGSILESEENQTRGGCDITGLCKTY